MPIHDWTRVPSGLFHDFHQSWSIRIKDALNAGRLPKGIAALVEQRAGPLESDVLAIESRSKPGRSGSGSGTVATLPEPVTRIIHHTDRQAHATRANRVLVKHHLGKIIAVIEILSPGNKDSRAALQDFVKQTLELLQAGIHVLIVDLFPPTPRDPSGIHKVIWEELSDEDFIFPAGKDRILVSYKTGTDKTAYIEPIAVGDVLPDMPLFLTRDLLVMVPLEPTYQATWEASPEEMRISVEHPLLERLLQFDKTAFPELEQLSKSDPQLCFDTAWAFITRVAEMSPHVPAEFVDTSLLLMQNAMSQTYTEDRLLKSWHDLGEETRGELCDSGISNPRVLTNDFCERLFFATSSTIEDRRVIVGSLMSTMTKRQFPENRLMEMLEKIGRYDVPELDADLERFVRHVRKGCIESRTVRP